MTRYGFIGTGAMGSMLVRKFIGTGMIQPEDISANSKEGISARLLAERTGIIAATSNTAIAENADVLFICVKPLEVRGVLKEVRDILKPGTLVVSVAACVTFANLEEWGGTNARYIRIIPSVTSEQESGVSLVAWGKNVRQEDRDIVISLFNAISKTEVIDERNFELYADLTSCAPGLMAAMMKEFAGAAVRTGTINPVLAEYLVKETMIGTARILANEQARFDDIVGWVATKGGITEEGVKILQARLPDVFDTLLDATLEKHEIIKEKVIKGE